MKAHGHGSMRLFFCLNSGQRHRLSRFLPCFGYCVQLHHQRNVSDKLGRWHLLSRIQLAGIPYFDYPFVVSTQQTFSVAGKVDCVHGSSGQVRFPRSIHFPLVVSQNIRGLPTPPPAMTLLSGENAICQVEFSDAAKVTNGLPVREFNNKPGYPPPADNNFPFGEKATSASANPPFDLLPK